LVFHQPDHDDHCFYFCVWRNRQITDRWYSALENADCLLIATEWSEFKNPNFEIMAEKMNNKAIFDGRNMFPLEQIQDKGFFYKSIGRKTLG
jgi:UDPglucose 6-dehydrogenase